MGDEHFDLRPAINDVRRLIDDLGWHDFHRARYLVQALVTEASELLDLTLWREPDEIDRMFTETPTLVDDELADIAINFFSLLDFARIDLNDAVARKVAELLRRHRDTPYGNSRGDKLECRKCRSLVEPAWQWCPMCGDEARRPVTEMSPDAGAQLEHDIERWERVAQRWPNRPSNQHWVHDYVFLPALLHGLSDKAQRILDAGCGAGEISDRILASRRYEIVAHDPSPTMRSLARTRLGDAAVVDSLDEIAPGSCDAAIANMVLTAVADPTTLLAAIKKALRPGGQLLVTAPHPCFTILRELHTTTDRSWVRQDEGEAAPIPETLRSLSRYQSSPVEAVAWESGGDLQTLLYNRTLTQYFTLFREAGYQVKDFAELLPVSEGMRADRRLYALFGVVPGYVMFDLRSVETA